MSSLKNMLICFVFRFPEFPTLDIQVSIDGIVECGSSVYDFTSFQELTHYYIFENIHSDNIISIDLLTPEVNSAGIATPLAHIRETNQDQTIIQSFNNHVLLTSLQIGTYIIQITSIVGDGGYNLRITCTITNSPMATPTHNPTLITAAPSYNPTNHPLSIPTASPTS